MKHILYICARNPSGLDFTLPLLWWIKKYRCDWNVSVLFTDITESRILRKSHFYSDMLKEINVKKYSYIDFIKVPNVYKIFIEAFSAFSPYDSNNKIIKYFVDKLISLLIKKIDFYHILKLINPDIILLDHHNYRRYPFPGFTSLMDVLRTTAINVVLIPHAPVINFTYLDNESTIYPFLEYWYPTQNGLEKFSKMTSKLVCANHAYLIGYPGLDTSWIDTLENQTFYNVSNSKIHILVLTHQYNNEIPLDVNLNELMLIFSQLKEVLVDSNIEYQLWVKPHPKSDYNLIKKLLKISGLHSFLVTPEPVYYFLNRIDIAIAVSTSAYYPFLVGQIPTIHISTKIEETLLYKESIKRLYEHKNLHVADITLFGSMLRYVLYAQKINQLDSLKTKKDLSLIRTIYPDEAIERAIKRLEEKLCI